MNTTRPKTPELDRLKANGWDVTSRDPTHPVPPNFDQLFARYAQINMGKIDAETKTLVAWHKHSSKPGPRAPAAPFLGSPLPLATAPPPKPKEDP